MFVCFFLNFVQSRWEEMDWKAESSFQSSEEEGGDEQNTNTSWYSLRASTHCNMNETDFDGTTKNILKLR